MRDYVIVTDSGCDLEGAFAKELGVRVVDLCLITQDDPQPRPNSQVDAKEFYDYLRTKKTATTSAVNTETFVSAMEAIVSVEDKDIIYIGFSSGLSNTYNAGRLACEEMSEKYPDRVFLAVDTLCASLGQGLLVYLATEKKREGATLHQLRDFLEDTKLHLCHWFTVDDLMFLKRGGRVSAATAVVGSALGIKPVMHVDNDGHLVKVSVARSRRASIDAMFEKVKAGAIRASEQTMFICHGDCISDAEYLKSRLCDELGVKKVYIGYTGVVIGSHSGPGTLAVFYLGNER